MSTPEAMVFAICHEVGNLLAAIRLHGEFRDADGARRVAELSARSGSLLSLVRPLLDESSSERMALDPVRLLDGVRTALDDPSDPRLDVDPATAAELPPLLADGEVLHHLFVCELLAAFERLDSGERLRLVSFQDGERAVFALSGGAPERPPAEEDRLAGRALSQALAAKLLGRAGGSVRCRALEGRQCVELAVPLA